MVVVDRKPGTLVQDGGWGWSVEVLLISFG